MIASVLAQAGETTATSLPLNDVLLAIALLIIALVLLLLEFVVASYGMLAVAALGCAITGIVIGFATAPAIGWLLLAATPILGALVVSWGLRRLMRSDLVPKQEITEDAGYRHASDSLGITVGARGKLITDAVPTGRAHFPRGEIDVVIEGPAANKGAQVVVRRIEGPTVIVVIDPGSVP